MDVEAKFLIEMSWRTQRMKTADEKRGLKLWEQKWVHLCWVSSLLCCFTVNVVGAQLSELGPKGLALFCLIIFYNYKNQYQALK